MEREHQQSVHQLIETSLEQVVQGRLLDAEAASRKISREQLLAKIKPAAVTDADVDAFYKQNKAQIPRPKREVGSEIKSYLEQLGEQQAKTDYLNKLQDKYKVEYKLEPFRVQVAATGPVKGRTNAPVTIVEFLDFECPFSSGMSPTLQAVEKKYGDKVRVVCRQYPLSSHPNAQKAAEASLCAQDQGKFWEMHDAMFADQKKLGVEQLKATAASLGLNTDNFNKCIDSGEKHAIIQADLKEGQAAGVSGTPAIFVNGRFFSGVVPMEQLTTVIDDELRRAGNKTASR
ncbi:MAG TPA: thioredoxin domain-containing protein [Chthoniobacterales bacterium]